MDALIPCHTARSLPTSLDRCVTGFVTCVRKLTRAAQHLKDNIPHNTCQIYVKPHSKNTQMTLESQIFDEKGLR